MKDAIYRHISTGEEIKIYKSFRSNWVSVWNEQYNPEYPKFPYSKKEVLEEAIRSYNQDEDYEFVRFVE
jgi:hypothetical protein